MAAIDEFVIYYFNPALKNNGQKVMRAESFDQAAINFNLAHPALEIDVIECSDETPEGWVSQMWK